MLILTFPNGCFPVFCQFCMEKKEFAEEMKNLYDFSLMHIRPFDENFNYNKKTLLGVYLFKVNNKNIRTRYETCLKLNLKNKYTRTNCQTVFCCFYCYLWTYFLLGSSIFFVDFEHLNDEWKCCMCILTIAFKWPSIIHKTRQG